MRGIIYRDRRLYRLAMRMLYGKDFIRRYELIAANVDTRWSVLDLCCGDCYIAQFFDASVKYAGVDFNKMFVRNAQKRGFDVSFCDLKKGLPIERVFDCVIMMGSLHQFSPRESAIIDVMKKTASRRIIVSEPCKNVVSSKNAVLSFVAKILSNPGDDGLEAIKRFTRKEIVDIFTRHNVSRIIDAGKDLIGVFDL